MAAHVERCIQAGHAYSSRLPEDILLMHGMSGQKTRHFYNNLLNAPGARYLEIGVYKGSSTAAALFGNPHVDALAIDDWSGALMFCRCVLRCI